ncbi:flavin-containing monooxygenase [Lapillicoccus jejuensis]|uniref:Cation diffusion facilitator CzcD-associated flavoprotein CzcO n=1 Tax=Lapillicoccus jejuensis TaxID=402171 RepID=A0A542DXA0_9MICO|nr:NAD(P)/FAD-dependent oxidoreductase [Lapillicoccus jejuensis]TQJ07723.1 cation diffusion facilitator CzcD-associated flavoprotein CzcO [Lapillicoccus jejuensis]
MSTTQPERPEHLDVVIVGAGISGVDAAYRVQQQHPGRTYAVLEGRAALGGTWDLFRYPGIRSDSDIFSFGFPFKPWKGDALLAGGTQIREYIEEAVRETGIDRHIRYAHRVARASWDSDAARWELDLEVTQDGRTERRTLTCSFLLLCTGYYRYDEGFTPQFAGRDEFAGQVVHPQHWPQDLDVAGRRVVVIGSGATAITLVPALADLGADVTMLQRTPTWIAAVPSREAWVEKLRGRVPEQVAHRILRAKHIGERIVTYALARRFPALTRRALLAGASRTVGADVVREHFTPPYNPWDQRICAAPGGDFFRALADGRTHVVTDHVDRFVPEGVRLRSGRTLPADVVVTATGLQLLMAGGIEVVVDGEPVDLSSRAVWRGAMIEGIPNLAFVVGYVNSSWTLRADLTAQLVTKVLTHLDEQGLRAVAPVAPAGLGKRPVIDLTSGYVRRAISAFPHQGDRAPWTIPQNYVVDRVVNLRGRFTQDLRPWTGRGAPTRREDSTTAAA